VLPGKTVITVTTGFLTLLFAGVLLWWLLNSRYPRGIVMRVPGMDNRPKLESRSDSVIIGEFFDTLKSIDEVINPLGRFFIEDLRPKDVGKENAYRDEQKSEAII
jgi:hypothetical protein